MAIPDFWEGMNYHHLAHVRTLAFKAPATVQMKTRDRRYTCGKGNKFSYRGRLKWWIGVQAVANKVAARPNMNAGQFAKAFMEAMLEQRVGP